MIATIRIGGALFLAITVCLGTSLDRRRATRILQPTETSVVVGGNVCADEVKNSTDSCFERECTITGSKYRCTGTKTDQFCTAATTNTGNYCDKGSAYCGGKQQTYFESSGKWYDDGDCKTCTYVTARLQAGVCTVP
jgi:hypothetical protein